MLERLLTAMRWLVGRGVHRNGSRDLKLLFSPVWNAQIEAIVLNRCLLDTSGLDCTASQQPAPAGPDQTAPEHAELDYLTLTKSFEALHQLLTAGQSAMMLVPVDFRTVHDDATLAEYMRLLSTTPSTAKCLALEINGIPSDCPADRLGEMVRRLETCVRHLAVEVRLDDPRASAIAGLGPWALSVDLGELSVSDPCLPARLRQFTATARGVNTLARGANSTGLAVAASEAGFTYVDGAAINRPVREPLLPRRLRPLPRSAQRSVDLRSIGPSIGYRLQPAMRLDSLVKT
jgi:hypothetical protein